MPTVADLDDRVEDFGDLHHFERIRPARGELLEHLATGLQALERAAGRLDQLRSNTIYDVDFVDGRDGGDVATFLDDSVRYARAAYAVVHTVIDKEAP